ncbi:hypothetical protein NPIL_71141 [Nephila pilipes]|uniref:Uncharacterized protein n=1 Tax=Nephila pilipes TaxID=299642 RepID=A0A8X6T790_NEPPI|nr:hypothetical protein NPIL_71141 [Nephila pilipes]
MKSTGRLFCRRKNIEVLSMDEWQLRKIRRDGTRFPFLLSPRTLLAVVGVVKLRDRGQDSDDSDRDFAGF